MAQLAARLIGDQKLAGLNPPSQQHLFHGDLIMKYFLQSFFLRLIQEGHL